MPSQAVTLLFADRPLVDFSAIARRAEEISGEEFDYSNRGNHQKSFQIFHKNHQVGYNDGKVFPSSTAFFISEKETGAGNYRSVIEQSWSCKNAEYLIGSGKHCILMTEMMADGLEPQVRLSLFNDMLQSAIEIAKPQALIFHHSQQVIDPAKYLECCDLEPIMRPGAINVRFFNIADSDGEMLMDTCGMEEIGLHDFQCHFQHLNPDDVLRVLFNTAVYIAENGAVIESGQTVAGIDANSRWSCQFEESLIEPKRVLLDLNPGFECAAGRTTQLN